MDSKCVTSHTALYHCCDIDQLSIEQTLHSQNTHYLPMILAPYSSIIIISEKMAMLKGYSMVPNGNN